MAFYPKSVAYTRMFKMISSADHLSLKTLAAPVVNISKAGAAFAAAGGTVTEVASGWYKVALTTTDTGTAGDLAFYITGTGADDTDFVDQVFDVTVANLGVNVVNIANAAAVLDANNLLKVDTEDWKGGVIPAVTVTGVPLIDLRYTLGTLSPAVAGSVAIDWGQVSNKTATNALTNTTVATVTTVTGSVGSVTGAVGSVTGSVGSVTGAVGSVTGNVGGNVTGSVGSVAGNVSGNVTGSVGSVLTGGLTDLTVTTYAEASAVPAATATLKDKIIWLATLARNKITQTSTTTLLRNDTDSATVGTSTVGDDSVTFTRGKFS